jgi:hypothetical protein
VQLTARYPKIMVSADGTGIVSQAGGLLLIRALRVTGLDRGLDAALERWRPAHPARQPARRADRPQKNGHEPQPQATHPPKITKDAG